MDRAENLAWLREADERRLAALWQQADAVRREHVGHDVHLRGLIEFSNHCVRRCAYCGLRAEHEAITRYRMTADEILDCAQLAVGFGYGTVVLQSGEDYGIDAAWMADVVRRIKATTPLAVTLSLGERPEADLLAWREAGADRYLLRFETSDPQLYGRIHPPLPGRHTDRVGILRDLRRMGYEIGSGVMVGIPGQTMDTLADDIELFHTLDLDMIGLGPYIPHPDTPLYHQAEQLQAPEGQQVPATEDMTYRVLALARLACPDANIPSTTALATLNQAEGRELGLQRGANVVMPNLTPVAYRALYEIYPAKVCIHESAGDCQGCIKQRIQSVGRTVGTGRGDSPRLRHTGTGAFQEQAPCVRCPQ
ncbi:[FeFe] hydrogenase H-cluster radical SAM maturase HydE [bacterium]|nr:[FeFe] hydrogenase H-cluster radical SAM maturase HydE [bacterium]